MHTDGTRERELWRDPSAPVQERVAALVAEMTLEEKVAQLYGVWAGVDPDGDDVAPHQHELVDTDLDFATSIAVFAGNANVRPAALSAAG